MTVIPPERPAAPPSLGPRAPVSASRLPKIAHAIYSLILIGFAVPALCVGAIFIPGPLEAPKNVVVPHGTRTMEIGAQLARENAIETPILFRVAALVAGPPKAGEYALPAYARPFDIAKVMHEGISVVHAFTAAEGLTSTEIVKLLTDDHALTGTVPPIPPEGTLLPETYYYTYNDSRAGIIARMQKAMREELNELWMNRERDLPLKSIDEAVALASIVEKETGKPAERPRIAGVFINRLRRNMRLQSDPTVIYALTSGKTPLERALTHDDLSVPSPVNTYMNDGIPPQPICNPGRAALEAVLHPERNTYLYFVADGAGGHVFANDLIAHNQNVAQWRKVGSAHP